MNLQSPREIDEALAAEDRALANLDWAWSDLTGSARPAHARRDSTATEIWAAVKQAAANGDKYDLCIGKRPSQLLTEREQLAERRAQVQARIDALDSLYTGWSRFFLVTSSAGHVHSSRACHTCYPATTYGWRPELSGKTEAEAVAALGDTLCSICFPSLRTGKPKKISKAAARKLAA